MTAALVATTRPGCERRPAMRWLWPGAGEALRAEGAEALLLGGATPLEAGVFGDATAVEAAATNLVTNPSFEVDAAGWAAFNSATAVRDTGDAYRGGASLLVTADGAGNDEGATQSPKIAVSPSTAYACSMWFKGAAGDVQINVNAYDAGDVYITTHVGGVAALGGDWQRVVFVFTTGASTAKVDLYALTWGTQAISFRVDAVQLEAGGYATSYLDGSLGSGYSWAGTAHASTSTRAAARVQAAPGILEAARGALVAWLRPPWASTSAPTLPRVLRWAASANEALELRFDDATQQWQLRSTAGGGTDTATSAVDAFAAGASKVVAGMWDQASLWVSVDGGAPVHAARAAGVPAIGAALADLGSLDGTTGHLDAVLGPVAVFDRPLTPAELAVVRRLARAPGWREPA